MARPLVAAKIRNCRVLLRRNGDPPAADLRRLKELAAEAETARDAEVLLGLEGLAARVYFAGFAGMLKGPAAGGGEVTDTAREPSRLAFDFESRNRHPPRDPVNALLSFAYTLLTKDWVVTLYAAGFDPLMGLYHQPRYGKPALALDLMEPFRPLVADSVVVGALNNGEVQRGDFLETEGGVLLKPTARKRFLAAYERRLTQEVLHPLFDYRVTYRRLFDLQARLLGRHLLGELPAYPCFETR